MEIGGLRLKILVIEIFEERGNFEEGESRRGSAGLFHREKLLRRSLVCREREKGVEVRDQARDFIFLVKAGPTDRRLFHFLCFGETVRRLGVLAGKMRGRQIEDDKVWW